MNNKYLAWGITVLCVVLAIVLIVAVVKMDEEKLSGGNIITGFFTPTEENNENESETFSEINEEGVGIWNDPVFGEDDGFEGSVIPNSSQSSSENNSEVSSESSVETNNGNSESVSSRPSSDSSSATSSDSSSDTSSEESGEMTYEKYISMSPEEQQKYMMSFESVEKFFEWFNEVKAKYEAENEAVEGNGSIDIGDYMNP